MAPKKVNLQPKVVNTLVGIRKSKRISTRLAVFDSSDDSDCTNIETQSIKKKTTTMYEYPQLNDDCLLEIFSFLPIKQLLYDVGMCCHQFRELAEVTVQKKCRTERFSYNYSDARDTSIVNRFGKLMRSVFVFQRYKENTKTDSLTWIKRCTALKILKIQNFNLIYDSECFVTFGKLEKLTFDRCFGSVQQYEHIITACKNLKSIALLNWTHDAPDDILAQLSTLKNIERMTSHHDISKSSGSCKNLLKIAQLQKLKFLCFNIGFCEQYATYINALSGSASLEELILNVNFIDENIADALDEFSQLKSCQMNHECWLTKKAVRWNKNRLKSDISKLRKKIKNFDVKENFSVFAENKTYAHIKLCVTLTRFS